MNKLYGFFITKNMNQSILRISFVFIIIFTMVSLGLAISSNFQIEAKSMLFGFQFSQPTILIDVIRLVMSVWGAMIVTIPVLAFIWISIEERYFKDE